MTSTEQANGVSDGYVPLLSDEVADGGWEEDSWDDGLGIHEEPQASSNTSSRPSVLSFSLIEPFKEQAAAAGNQGLDMMKTFGRRLFQRESGSAVGIGTVFFGKNKPGPARTANALVPLLGSSERLDDYIDRGDEEAAGSGRSFDDAILRETQPVLPLPLQRLDTASDEIGISQRLEQVDMLRDRNAQNDLLERRDSRPQPVPKGWLYSQETIASPNFIRKDSTGWRQKVGEVLPVLAIVALGVLGTVLYLAIVDGVWGDQRAEFSLSCNVGDGKWVQSSKSTLYAATCPYIRNEFNCHKYGLESSEHEGWRWEPRHCVVPKFDPHDFLRTMSGRSIAFIGDRSTANEFDSLICMLAEAEPPETLLGAVEVLSGTRGQAEEDEAVDSAVEINHGAESRENFQENAGGNSETSWPNLKGWRISWGGHNRVRDHKEKVSGFVIPDNFGGGDKLVYRFEEANVTLALFHSPFLVQTVKEVAVNSTACQLTKVQSSSRTGVVNDTERTASADSFAGSKNSDMMDACYPNRVDISLVDSLWASEANQYDVLVLNSGRGWREEEMETQGLGVYIGQQRQENLTLEGLVGEWAYPKAMSTVIDWLASKDNFNGNTIYRAYSPSHQRRECAGRIMLNSGEAENVAREDNYTQYNMAVTQKLVGFQGSFLNVSFLSAERGDGHPWMASPRRPTPDCSNWCLPGVPDTWNEILAATLMKMFPEKNGKNKKR